MAKYLQDPGSVLSNAIFGSGAFGGERVFNDPTGYSWTLDEATGKWNSSGYNPVYTPDNYSPPDVSAPAPEWAMKNASPMYGLTGKGLENFSDREGVMNRDNIKVVDKIDGGYLVMSKTGDKKGTVYAVMETPDGNYKSAGVVQDNVPFDTNSPWWKEALPIIAVAAAPLMAYAGQALYAGMGGAGAGGVAAAETIGAADALANIGWGAEAANAGLGFGGVSGGAWSVPGMTTAATTAGAPLAFQGTETLLNNLQNAPGTENLFNPENVNLEDVVRMPEVEINPPPPTPPEPIELPPYEYPPPTPPDFPIPEVPPIQGTNPKVPGIPGKPGGDGSGDFDLGALFSLVDMWNKYQTGKDQTEFFNNWIKKVFGQSAEFENQLMNTYTNPMGWVSGPEGQAMSDELNRVGLRQSMKGGFGTNSTNRDRLWQQGMLKGINDYRSGLVNSANIGRSQSGPALQGAGKAFQGFADSRNWYTPGAFGAGNSGQTGLKDIWNLGTEAWNTGKNIWDNISNWFSTDV